MGRGAGDVAVKWSAPRTNVSVCAVRCHWQWVQQTRRYNVDPPELYESLVIQQMKVRKKTEKERKKERKKEKKNPKKKEKKTRQA